MLFLTLIAGVAQFAYASECEGECQDEATSVDLLQNNVRVAKTQSSAEVATKKDDITYWCEDVGSGNIALDADGNCPAWVVNGGHCGKEWAISACPASCEECPKPEPIVSSSCGNSPHPNGVFDLTADGECPSWIVTGGHCGKDWTWSYCAETCELCETCEESTAESWGECSSTCGGGTQYRSRYLGTCEADGETIIEAQQCNPEACDPPPDCTLESSDALMITEDGTIVENKIIITTGKEAAIYVNGASNVILRNIKIVHQGHDRVTGSVAGIGWMDESGAGIYFKDSPNILIENVHVSLVRDPNPNANDGKCADQYCGPFPIEWKYAYNIYGRDSSSPTLKNVYVTGGSTGFWCTGCEYGHVSQFKAENLHGPYPRGQCFQVVSSTGFTLEDFTCVQDNQIAFPEDSISIWNSPDSLIQRGYIEGGNAPNGVGVISEMSHNVLVQDVDVTLNGGTTFSSYGATNVTFLRTRAKNNHVDTDSCLDAQGYCKDFNGQWPNSNFYAGDPTVPDRTCECSEGNLKRCDTEGGVWFSGDYTDSQAGAAHTGHNAENTQIKQGVFYGITAVQTDTTSSTYGTCIEVGMDSWQTSAANRQESYLLKDFVNEDFELRSPWVPQFCFPTA